jgi:hypothetical protein
MGGKKTAEGKDQVVLSQAIRTKLKSIEKDAKRLEELQKEAQVRLDEKKLKVNSPSHSSLFVSSNSTKKTKKNRIL